MNQNEEVPDNLGGLGDLLPADVLKKVNELLEKLHQADSNHQGSIVLNIYGKGSLHVDHVDTQNFYGDACPKPQKEKGNIDAPTLPPLLRTDKAMVLWIAERLGIKEKWKVFEGLWNRKYMRSDYNLALTRKRTLDFQDELKQLFG